jgi:enoyl-CoA hydratase/carnithine racemase
MSASEPETKAEREASMDYETITYDLSEHAATVTLNRPDRLNAFNQRMMDEFEHLWGAVRLDDDVRVVVLQAEGERAFSTGLDVREGWDRPANVWSQRDPGAQLGPKHNQVWKPVVTALHGMVAGGALYWVNESDIVICSDDATFFDPHVSYGLTAALEPIGLLQRVPLGEVLRMTLLGLDERMSAARAREIGLVSEVVSRADLRSRAAELARIIAAKPPAAIQGSVRAIWESLDMTRSGALQVGMSYTHIGNPLGQAEVDRGTFDRPKWQLR